MAARSVFKLITKSCSYTINTACTTPAPTITSERNFHRANRSLSLPPKGHSKSVKETLCKSRFLSRSNTKLTASEQVDDYDEDVYRHSVNRFPKAKDVLYRETAREFSEKVEVDENPDNSHPIYELSEGTRNAKNYYDIFRVVRGAERDKRMYMHLQPSNLRPYGSREDLHFPQNQKKNVKIVYPTIKTATHMDRVSKKSFDEAPIRDLSLRQKEFSSKMKEYPGYEEVRKLAICNKKSGEFIRMNYSTSCGDKNEKNKRIKPVIGTMMTRKSSTLLIKKRKSFMKKSELDVLEPKIETKEEESQLFNFAKNVRKVSSKELFFKPRLGNTSNRKYNTQSKADSPDPCSDYVTVKLGELQEECRKVKKCKPKKLSFGTLPKLSPPDCPCIEDYPLKEGKPLNRLKKRFDVTQISKICKTEACDPSIRADFNYKVKPKTLPVIYPQECPCVETHMTDFVIRRLPKRKIPEPPKICPCEDMCCDPPPRADYDLKIEKKILPKLKSNKCPCIEPTMLIDVPLKRLEKKVIKEPEKKLCFEEKCNESLTRADYNMKITKKVLPTFKSECVCIEPPPLAEGKPIKRLKKMKYVEKPRAECKEDVCEETTRADAGLKHQPKKLPIFVPKTCPCIEPEMPSVNVNLKRLQPKPVDVNRKDGDKCFSSKCGERADDGMVVKPKKLPKLEAKPCPCVEEEMFDCEPLKKLVPRPVQEPPKICLIEECPEDKANRADGIIKVEPKKLPVLRPGDCPCIELPSPVPAKPLKKLQKKEITFERVCSKAEVCPERADEHLKVKVKHLPKLKIADCPCPEITPPEDSQPLKRLRKVHIPEPEKICKNVDDCEEASRADEDDWLYWKRVEVKPAECNPKKDNKRSFSTFSKRYYTTRVSENSDVFGLKYEVPQTVTNTLEKQSYNIIIDIKPSAPLVLTQKAIPHSKNDNDYSFSPTLKSSKSEPLGSVTFVIYKNNGFGNTKSINTKEATTDVSSVFNNMNRSISTCSSMIDPKRNKESACECTGKVDPDLQPRKPIIKEREQFIETYPPDDAIQNSSRKGRLFEKRRDSKNPNKKHASECEDIDSCVEEKIDCTENNPMTEDQKSLWHKVVNYFKARPNCPSPEEFKRMKLKEEAERAASKAGLCLYDPKEMLRKNEKDLPKVITADSTIKDECTK